MQFIKTLFWVLLAVTLVVFSVNNWANVTIKIWDETLLDTKLPVLVISSFLLGFLPMWIIHRGVKWRMKRRIAALESATNSYTPPGNITAQTSTSAQGDAPSKPV